MCKVIAVSNQKGGVGKTVSCVNLGIGLAKEGKKVLLIDGDPQGSLTISLGYEEPDEMEYSLATLMMNIVNDEKLNMEKTILHHREGVDLIPANIELSAIEVSLVNAMSRELIIKSMMEKLREFYDFIIIDCMPSLGMITINALACADSVLIPVQAAYLPVKGLQQLIKTIGRVSSPLPFLTSPLLARICVVVINMWIGIPYTMMTFSGVLMNIPAELYESAKIDGAGVLQCFKSITLPYMIFVTAPATITTFVTNINNFNVIYLLTAGGPFALDYYQAGKTDLLVTWLYKLTVDQHDYALASTIGIFIFMIVSSVSLAVYNRTGSVKKEDMFQ